MCKQVVPCTVGKGEKCVHPYCRFLYHNQKQTEAMIEWVQESKKKIEESSI